VSTTAGDRVRRRVRVEGIVQGVGFRPYVFGLARRLGLTGFVGNDGQGVFIEVEGDDGAVAEFLRLLPTGLPPLAVVERVTAAAVPAVGEAHFTIVESRTGGERQAAVSPDTATCDACLAELRDATDRRYRYPFTNCTNCGPRFTIVRGVPYDRPLTTMAAFQMCERCSAEYHDPADRRFHAQPVCCPDCGPHLGLSDPHRRPLAGPGEEALAGAVARLRNGEIVAVKGLGGYHLAVRADDEAAVARLRARKHREEKPFAVMVADLEGAVALCDVGAADAALLAGFRRPIVLAPKRERIGLAPSVAPGNRSLGLMLPYTPLHHLLARDLGLPFVLTSGNLTDEPIASADDDAFDQLGSIADCFLVHDRAIHIRTDDSVVRSFRGRAFPLRRSRGFAPEPVLLPWDFPRPVLATGAELKSTFCLAKDRRAFVSHHIGDLENYDTYASFRDGIEHFGRLFDIVPEVVAHDLHPEYLSTKHAHDLAVLDGDSGVELTGVQHHHAHIASCLADNGEAGPVIGVAFDGLGFGPDGTIWGGEVLVADLAGFERVAHLAPVAMPGGAAAIREPWRMAAAYLDAAFDGDVPGGLGVAARNGDRWASVVSMARAGVSAPLTSSAGRLFDAVAAVLGVRDAVSYEGQAAVELEQLADPSEGDGYPLTAEPGTTGGALLLRGTELVQAVVADAGAGTPKPVVAARFHNGLAGGVVDVCRRVRADRGLGTVALSGGVFQNLLLLERTVAGLEAAGFAVLLHGRVPPNDGGISLGQAAVAGARDRQARTARP
jgi:hydrogenase maturation protein HypF